MYVGMDKILGHFAINLCVWSDVLLKKKHRFSVFFCFFVRQCGQKVTWNHGTAFFAMFFFDSRKSDFYGLRKYNFVTFAESRKWTSSSSFCVFNWQIYVYYSRILDRNVLCEVYWILCLHSAPAIFHFFLLELGHG